MPDGGPIYIEGWVLEETVSPTTKLQQGDLIVFANAEDPVRRTGIVITADCDLEQKKHGRLVTMIPIVPVEVIIERYLIIEDCEKKRESIEQHLFRNFEIEKSVGIETKRAMLRERLSLGLEGLRPTLCTAADLLYNAPPMISINSYRELMVEMKIPMKKVDGWKSQVKDRGDLFVVPDPKKLGITGCVAWLRYSWQAPISDIALRTSETAERPGERVARLDSPFRYRLTQLFGQVFSDIGLPTVSNSVDSLIEEAFRV